MEKTTTDHKEIQLWAEKKSGKPEKVIYKHAANGNSITLRINFPGPEDDVFLSDAHSPEPVTWDEFFEIFEEQQLAFIYVDSEVPADLSYHFIGRENIEDVS